MTAITPLETIHKKGIFGDHRKKDEKLAKLKADMEKQARANKDFALSDKIRDELLDLGIQLKDGREGTTFSIN